LRALQLEDDCLKENIMNIENILVPVDFSPTSRFAVDFAASFAHKFDCRLTLLHVVETSAAPTDTVTSGQLSGMISPEYREGLDLQTRIRSGNIEAEIRTAIDEEQPHLLVMGAHHRGLLRRIFSGSVTENILRKLPVPVVTVGEGSHFQSLSPILFATDLSETSQEGFRFALQLARSASANLVVLHSIEPLPISYGGALPGADIFVETAKYVEEARRKLSELEHDGAGLKVVVHAEVTQGLAAERILAKAEETGARLIVLTIHDKSAVERFLLGSTAEYVVREAHVPVLCIPIRTGMQPIGNTEITLDWMTDQSSLP
jgi:nucleotide-binding universal stress UspA family protein